MACNPNHCSKCSVRQRYVYSFPKSRILSCIMLTDSMPGQNGFLRTEINHLATFIDLRTLYYHNRMVVFDCRNPVVFYYVLGLAKLEEGRAT